MSCYILPTLNVSYNENKKLHFDNIGCLSVNDFILNKSFFEYISSTYDCVKKNKIDIKKNIISVNRFRNIKYESNQLSNPLSFLTIVEIINLLKEHINIPKTRYTVSNFGTTHIDFISAFNIIFKSEHVISYKNSARVELNVEKYDLILYTDSTLEELDYIGLEASQSNNILTIIPYIIRGQMTNGTAVFKVFDLYTSSSSYILYLLSNAYKNLYIFKPSNDDCGCSEKYIICYGFRLNDTQITIMIEEIQGLTKSVPEMQSVYPDFSSKTKFPFHYISKLNEINAILGQQSLESVNHTINFSNSPKSSSNQSKIDYINKKNQYNCEAWCKKHNIMILP